MEKTKYQKAVEACDAAWIAYEASGFDKEKQLEYRRLHGKKVMAFSEQLKESAQ